MSLEQPVELVRSDARADRAPYACAARVSGGDLLFTPGACPLDASGEIGPLGDYAGQAELVMANLRTALAAAGAGLADVAKTTVYVATGDCPQGWGKPVDNRGFPVDCRPFHVEREPTFGGTGSMFGQALARVCPAGIELLLRTPSGESRDGSKTKVRTTRRLVAAAG